MVPLFPRDLQPDCFSIFSEHWLYEIRIDISENGLIEKNDLLHCILNFCNFLRIYQTNAGVDTH